MCADTAIFEYLKVRFPRLRLCFPSYPSFSLLQSFIHSFILYLPLTGALAVSAGAAVPDGLVRHVGRFGRTNLRFPGGVSAEVALRPSAGGLVVVVLVIGDSGKRLNFLNCGAVRRSPNQERLVDTSHAYNRWVCAFFPSLFNNLFGKVFCQLRAPDWLDRQTWIYPFIQLSFQPGGLLQDVNNRFCLYSSYLR